MTWKKLKKTYAKKHSNRLITPKQFYVSARNLAMDIGKEHGMTKKEQRMFAAICLSSIGFR